MELTEFIALICSQSDSSKNIEHIQARSKVGITLPVKNEQDNYRTRDILAELQKRRI